MITGGLFDIPNNRYPMADRVAGRIRELLAEGTLAPGELLPNVRDPRWRAAGYTPNTVYRAYRILRDEGLVETRRPTGTFVRGRLQLPVRWDGRAVEVTLTVEQVGDLLRGARVAARMPRGDLHVVVRLAR